MAKLDLNKLKTEIQNEKQNRNIVPSQLGENVGTGVRPRDEFLNGLITSLHSGRETPSSNLIKVVENKVSEKQGENIKHRVNEQPIKQRPIKNMNTPSPERDEQLFADLEQKRKATLAESIGNFQGKHTTGNDTPSAVDFNGTQYLTSNPNAGQQPVQNNLGQINEGALVESVKNTVNNYLTENLGSVFEDAIKSTIIEMYAVERIQEVLNENRDLIKSVVVETIREIRDKSKAK